jgi:hypothetical protein
MRSKLRQTKNKKCKIKDFAYSVMNKKIHYVEKNLMALVYYKNLLNKLYIPLTVLACWSTAQIY